MVKQPSRCRHPRGFTLIELLVVLSIVALLLTLALPRYFGAVDKSKTLVLKENLRSIRVCIDRYYADRGAYPESLAELVELRYLKSIPVDPVLDSDQQWVLIPPDTRERGHVADVKSGASGNAPDGEPYASF